MQLTQRNDLRLVNVTDSNGYRDPVQGWMINGPGADVTAIFTDEGNFVYLMSQRHNLVRACVYETLTGLRFDVA